MHDSEPQFYALQSLCKSEIIEIHDSSKRGVSLFDQLLAHEVIPIEPESAIEFLDIQEQRVNKQCKIEEESHPVIQVSQLSRTQEEPQRTTMRNQHSQCNCQRSLCVKNYCPCYKERNGCGKNCKCKDCHNKNTSKKKVTKTLVLSPFWSSKDLRWN